MRTRLSWRLRTPLVLLLAAGLAVSVAAPAGADVPTQAQRRFGVMTYNLYFGADLSPIFGAPPDQLVPLAAAAWQDVQASDIPGRAEAMAKIIAREHPLVVGLQEAATWSTAPMSADPQWTTVYDPVALMRAELRELGAPYRVAVSKDEFVGALPVSATTLVRFNDRDVTLVRADLPCDVLRTTHTTTHTYSLLLPISIGGQSASLTRGWTSVDVQYRGKWFRFVNTHIEGYYDPIRRAQAAELATWIASSDLPVVATGDINSYRDWAGNSWQILVGVGGLTDAWLDTMPGVPDFTASFGDDLTGPPTELDHTVDYVFFRGATLVGVDGMGEVVGNQLSDQTSGGLYPSDHAGVVVTLRIVKDG
jgi:endonuclease/exonuclease/phosphatase family metal-dependent hydrolase